MVSGQMGYHSQADSAVFSEGFILQDQTENDLIKENIYNPYYISDVIKGLSNFNSPSGDFNSPLLSAPSVMKIRGDKSKITRDQTYSGINTYAPYNYNKFLWPAISDLKALNPDETIEAIAPDDGATYTNSTLLISASQGQTLSNGGANPDNRKKYVVQQQFQTYDSVATDSAINPQFATSGFGKQVVLQQGEKGVIVPFGATLTDVINGEYD
jgi:hypothetical protein